MKVLDVKNVEEYGQEFDTVDTLKGHQTSEREEHELRNKRIID